MSEAGWSTPQRIVTTKAWTHWHCGRRMFKVKTYDAHSCGKHYEYSAMRFECLCCDFVYVPSNDCGYDLW